MQYFAAQTPPRRTPRENRCRLVSSASHPRRRRQTDAACAISVEAANDGFGIRGAAGAENIKDVAIGDRRIGKRCRVLSLKRTACCCVAIGLRNKALG